MGTDSDLKYLLGAAVAEEVLHVHDIGKDLGGEPVELIDALGFLGPFGLEGVVPSLPVGGHRHVDGRFAGKDRAVQVGELVKLNLVLHPAQVHELEETAARQLVQRHLEGIIAPREIGGAAADFVVLLQEQYLEALAGKVRPGTRGPPSRRRR